MNHKEYVEGCERGEGPGADAAEGCSEGSRAGGCCLSPSPAAASDRERFLTRTGSAFLKAALLTLAARDSPGREVRLVGPQEEGELRAAALCSTPRLRPTQPVASLARGWSPAPLARRSQLLLCCLFTHPSSLRLAAWVPVPGKLKHRRLCKPTQTIGSKVHSAASSSEINISAS